MAEAMRRFRSFEAAARFYDATLIASPQRLQPLGQAASREPGIIRQFFCRHYRVVSARHQLIVRFSCSSLQDAIYFDDLL